MPRLGHQYYQQRGQGRPLVLLHGHTLDHRMWDELLPFLSANYRVITPDLAGHGQSGASPEGSTLADDLAVLLRHLGVERALICGLSMGGAVAINFALKHPEMCEALIPVDSAIFGFRFVAWEGPKRYAAAARRRGLGPALDEWLADPIFAPAMMSPAGPKLEQIVREFPGDPWLKRWAPGYDTEATPDYARLGEIQAPTLVVVGEADLPDFWFISHALCSTIPGARKVMISEAGHLPPMEQPRAFAAVLWTFLDTLPGA